MSVASLNNGSLQLSELVISNEKYSNATGYVASSSVFSSSTNGTYLNIDGNIVAEGGVLTLGTAPASVTLTGSTGNVSVGGGITTTNTVTAPTISVGTAPVDVGLSCTTNNVLAIGGSATATGSFSAPFYGGGMYAGLYSTPTVIAANSPATITIGSLPFNPIAGWVPSSIYPQFTLTSTYGDVGITGIGLTKNGDNTLTIELDVYNPNATNPQTLSSFYYFLFYA